MFKKVLIAEDLDSISITVNETLKSLKIKEIQHSKYCDDALLKVKKALLDNNPFDLLVTDLSFTADHRKVKMYTAEALINEIRKIQPTLKIVVYSVEDKSFRIKALFEHSNIDAFVNKGRKSISELKTAVKTVVVEDQKYISPQLASILQDKVVHEIDNFDVELIRQLALGTPQEEIETIFKQLDIKPSSKSAIEKRLGKLKDYFKAKNTVHLIAIAKDMGIA